MANEKQMHNQSQVSASISPATKEKLDRFTESRGLKKNFVVEQALLFFMDARRELPDEALCPHVSSSRTRASTGSSECWRILRLPAGRFGN